MLPRSYQHPLLRSAEAKAEEQRWHCAAAVGMVQQGQPMTVAAMLLGVGRGMGRGSLAAAVVDK